MEQRGRNQKDIPQYTRLGSSNAFGEISFFPFFLPLVWPLEFSNTFCSGGVRKRIKFVGTCHLKKNEFRGSRRRESKERRYTEKEELVGTG